LGTEGAGAPPAGPQSPPSPPLDLDALVRRAHAAAGRSVGELAKAHGYRVPTRLGQHKGFIGQLLEVVLGADAGSESRPDFTGLGIELKTLPIRDTGVPTQSTFVCKATIDGTDSFEFKDTALWHKLSCVLFFPVQGEAAIPLIARRFGTPFLWRPEGAEAARLEADWRALTGRIRAGELEQITGHDGEVLQLRPKAMNASERSLGIGAEGWLVPMPPRGWYLRPQFTRELIARAFDLDI